MVVYCRAMHASSSRTSFADREIPSQSMSADDGRPQAKEIIDGSEDTRKSSSRNEAGAWASLRAKGNDMVQLFIPRATGKDKKTEGFHFQVLPFHKFGETGE